MFFQVADNISKYPGHKKHLAENIKEYSQIKDTKEKYIKIPLNLNAKQYLYLNAERIVDEIVKALNIEAMRNLIWNFINNSGTLTFI